SNYTYFEVFRGEKRGFSKKSLLSRILLKSSLGDNLCHIGLFFSFICTKSYEDRFFYTYGGVKLFENRRYIYGISSAYNDFYSISKGQCSYEGKYDIDLGYEYSKCNIKLYFYIW